MAEDNTPTNVVDVGNVHDNPNYKVTLNVDNNGNVIIYRSTNTPDRFSDTDFSKFEINKTIGEQTYFASNPEFAQSFSQSGKRNIYSFSTNIKPEEILHLQSNIYKNKELLNKLGGQEYINNIINERGINNYRFDSLDNIPKNLTWAELYYSTNKGRTDGSKEILQREIVKLQNSGVKAIGVSPVSGAKNEYNILPIINEQSQLDIVAKGLFDKNLKETLLDTPTNVVDDVVVTQDRFGRDVTVTLDNNGNIILYRATDDPNRIIDSDFRPLSRDKGSVGLGQQSYFSPNPMYSHKYQSSGRKNYKFVTEIKPNQILPTDDIVKNYPELVNALNIPEEFTNQNWRQLVNDDKAMIAMGYETGGKRFFNDNIQIFLDNDIKAFGSGSTGTGGQTYIEYEIIPLVKEGDTLGIKPIATLQTKEGFAAGKSPEAFIETLLDTSDRPFGPGAAYIDEILNANTQLVDNLPLESVVKNRVKNLVAKKTAQAATPGGIMDAVDAWELAVLGLMAATVAFNEIDEVPTIITNTAVNMFNSMTSFYGIPPVKNQEYNIDYEFVTKVLDTGEKIMPTDIIIKKVGDVVKGAAETGAVTGFGYVPPNLTKTDTMETTQKIQPGVQEEKMFEQAKPKKSKATGGAGAKIL